MKITLKELSVFYYVVKYHSVKSAADTLCITQSAASQALSKLENSLNKVLFDRNGRQLILNENGRLLLPLVVNMLNTAQEIESLFHESHISLKIGASTTIANYLMPEYLSLFRQQFPTSKVDMSVNNTEAVIAAVANFDVDIGLIEGPCNNNDLIVQEWQEDELVIFIANQNKNRKMTYKQLQSLPWLLREKGSGTRDIVQQFLHSHLGHFHLDMELGNSEAIKYAVAADLGISCLSRYVVNDLLEQQKVMLVNCPLPKLTRKFYIIIHRNKQYTQGMKNFLALICTK